MPTSIGPKPLANNNLLVSIDTYDVSNGITPLGCGGFNGSTQGLKNLLNDAVYLFENGVLLNNRSYFTSFAIDYPEGSFGAEAANRQGITEGYNIKEGGKLYDASRALHLWVYNNDTNSWIDNGSITYFRGARLEGHCYDNYSGAETGYLNEITLFIEDYNNIKSIFPNCTYIIAGSHRADQYTLALRTILYDLGMPTGYLDSDYIAAPEWILVGKPGLGTGKAYGWVYENYTTDPTRVAHINFGLPIKAKGEIYFDGTDDRITIPDSANLDLVGDLTIETMLSLESSMDGQLAIIVNKRYDSDNTTPYTLYFDDRTGQNAFGFYIGLGSSSANSYIVNSFDGIYNKFNHIVGTVSGNTINLYVNGALKNSVSFTGTRQTNNYPIRLAGDYTYNSNNYMMNGKMNLCKIYNRALSLYEIQQNYQQYKSRFNS